MQSTSQANMAAPSVGSPVSETSPSSPEWLSAFMDGEQEFDDDVLPAALTSADGRTRWDTYHLIGDVLRSPALGQPASRDLHARLVAALDDEPSIIAAPRRSKQRRFMNRYGFPGLAAAAAVASVTWVAQPYFGSPPAGGIEFAAQAENVSAGGITAVSAPVQLPRGIERAGNVTAGGADPAVEFSLGEYIDAHRQISGRSPIRRVSNISDSQEGQR